MISRLVVLTDRHQVPPGSDLLACLRQCVASGLGTVVVREHDLDPGCRHRLLRALSQMPGLRVVSSRIDDPVAAGVHLAAHQPAPAAASRTAWGRSCHSAEEVRTAAASGAGWVTLSPWAATASKPGYGPALPPTAFAGHPVPVLALGGVRPANAAAAVAAGAHGVAVMGEVMRAEQPGRVVAALLEAVR